MTEENSTETVAVVENKDNRRIRSSFTMSKDVMAALKERAANEGNSVSFVIEKAVTQYVGK